MPTPKYGKGLLNKYNPVKQLINGGNGNKKR
jgi:hypothetical protein